MIAEDTVQTYICPQHIWLKYKKGCIIQESKYLIVYLSG
jgi:hypothetical protein